MPSFTSNPAAHRALLPVMLVSLTLALSACATKKLTDASQSGSEQPAAATVNAADAAATGPDASAADGAVTAVQADDRHAEAVRGKLKDTVYFAFDSATLTPAAMATLRAQAKNFRDTSIEVRVEGHADERGTPEYNLALGQRRADLARSFLIAEGIPAGRVEAVSYGELKPVASGHDEASWKKNRRVEIRVGR